MLRTLERRGLVHQRMGRLFTQVPDLMQGVRAGESRKPLAEVGPQARSPGFLFYLDSWVRPHAGKPWNWTGYVITGNPGTHSSAGVLHNIVRNFYPMFIDWESWIYDSFWSKKNQKILLNWVLMAIVCTS